MLHKRIMQKKEQVHKTKNIAENDKLSIEIDTLHWVLSKCFSIRRLLKGQASDTLMKNSLHKNGIKVSEGRLL